MALNSGIINSKILKQHSDVHNTTQINILDVILDQFTKTDYTIPTLKGNSSGSQYYIDSSDYFKLKKNNNIIVSDGFYKLKSNINIDNINGVKWCSDNFYLYKIVDGLPLSYANSGYYIDLINNILIYVNNDGIPSDVNNGYYYYNNPYNIFYGGTKNIIIKHGTYILSFKNKKHNINDIIYYVSDGITKIYNGYFININNDKYYYNHKLLGICDNGAFIVCDDKLLIRGIKEWKYTNLLPLKL